MPLLDCGLMFPDADMPASTSCCPTSPSCASNADRIEASSLTHGHEDHVGGLSFLLRELLVPDLRLALTLGLARNRIEEAGLLGRTEPRGGRRRAAADRAVRRRVHPVTHSVPHGFATAFHTPQGVILHSGDFKLDLTPVDGRLTDLGPHRRDRRDRGRPAAAVRLDQRRGAGHVRAKVGEVLARPVPDEQAGGASSPPASPATSTASSRSPTPPSPSGRVVATLGLSMRQERAPGPRHGAARHPDRADRHRGRRGPRPGEVCVISTGSQGEPMSALTLMAQARTGG